MKAKYLVCLAVGLMCIGMANAAGWWKPTPATSWQIQLQGKINKSFNVKMYDIDLFDTPQSVIDNLHSRGIKVACYFNAGGFEEWRDDAGAFPAAVLGKALDNWPGERWLDIRRIGLLAPIMEARLNLAQEKLCDGVDPDNVDGYTNATGFPLTAEDQLDYNRWLSEEAHARGLAVGLKNDLDQIIGLVTHFDFAINEQCQQYQECDLLTPFIMANKPVFEIEYKGNRNKVCMAANRRNFDALMKRLDLNAWRRACR
ncbi:MAG: endo alpha-1,4 polygalactosaminidase [Methylovulum sp.]|nr:endo alpha-1,4 polygalactosaminidase [Methylovulum sp.]